MSLRGTGRRPRPSGGGGSDGEAGAPERRERPAVPAYQRALGLLVRREHSAVELKRKLRDRGIGGEELDTALETLQRQGFQDDRRYAAALIRSRALAGQGPVRVRAELRANGVSSEAIDAALEAAEADGLDWFDVAARVGARFRPALRAARGLEGLKQRQKAVAFLLRRGFSQTHAKQAFASDGAFDDDAVD